MRDRPLIEQFLDEGTPITPGGRPLAGARRVPKGRRLTSKRQRKPRNRNVWNAPIGHSPNWITAAVTKDLAPKAIVHWSAKFTVPQPPPAANNQIIYLFIGLQDEADAMILQPVLQWNLNEQFRNQWSVSSWFVRQGEESKLTPPVAVLPGAVLHPTLRMISRRGSDCLYECGFAGIDGTQRRAADLPSLRRAVCTLEAYWVGDCQEYPASSPVSFTDLMLATENGPATPQMRVVDWIIDCGQHCEVGNGRISLHCR